MDSRLLLKKKRGWVPQVGEKVYLDFGSPTSWGPVRTFEVLRERAREATLGERRRSFIGTHLDGEPTLIGRERSVYLTNIFPMTDDNNMRALLRTPALSLSAEQLPAVRLAFDALKAGQL